MLSCNDINELAARYVDNEVDEAMRKQIEEHLENCESCKQEVKLLHQILNTLGSLDEQELPPEFNAELHQKLVDTKEQESIKNKGSFIGKKQIQTIVSIAAGLFLVAVLKDLWGNLSLPSAKKEMSSTTNSMADVYSQSADKSERINEELIKRDAEVKHRQVVESVQTLQAAETVIGQSARDIKGTAEEVSPAVANSGQPAPPTPASNTAGKETTERKDSGTSRESEARKSSEAKQEAITPTQENKPLELVATAMTAKMAVNASAVRSVNYTVKTEKQEFVMGMLKTVANAVEAKINETDQVSSKMAIAAIPAVPVARTIVVKVPNVNYERFKELISTNFGVKSIEIGEVTSRDVSADITALNKKLDEINQMLFNMEVQSSTVSPREIEKLKQDRMNTLSELERLNSDIGFITVSLTIVEN